MVLFGTLTTAQLDPNATDQGTTDLRIEVVIKGSEMLGNQRVITLAQYIPIDNPGSKFLAFCDVEKGKIDPYRRVPVKANSNLVKYLQGALAVKDKPIGVKLRFFWDYLDNPDPEVSADAYIEFGNAPYADYREMAKHLPAQRIAKWLQDADTPAHRLGLYGATLGHCGTPKDAVLLRGMLDHPDRFLILGLDGMLVDYTLLQPNEGWAYIRAILGDPTKEFMIRYAALRAARFFWESGPNVVNREEVVEGVCLLLPHVDLADLAIEDLRRWGRWEPAAQVLCLYKQPSHDLPIVRRAIVRYALTCPGSTAANFVARVREKDPDRVRDTEELLKVEAGIRGSEPARIPGS